MISCNSATDKSDPGNTISSVIPAAQKARDIGVHANQREDNVGPKVIRPPPMTAAERMRRSRKRRRANLRCIPFVIYDREIEALVTNRWLDPVARNDRRAIGIALGELLDAVTRDQWPGRR